VAIGEEAESVDPASSVLFASDVYHVHMFDALIGLEGEELKPVPLLAERWENVNPTTWRFHLRRNVKFGNGEPLDAEDVKYSFETYIDPKNRRAPFARGITRVEVRDPHTVDVITEGPLASALFNVVRCYILPKETREKVGAQAFAQQPVGTGPYKLVEWKRDQQLVLEANPHYWRGAVTPRRLVFRVIKDASTRAAELRSGGVDIIAAPPVPQLDLLDSGDSQVVPVKGGRVLIYLMHLKQPPSTTGRFARP
jgi:peptide/nickel transport system substrate-binding protein